MIPSVCPTRPPTIGVRASFTFSPNSKFAPTKNDVDSRSS